jgi:hypothetical protein
MLTEFYVALSPACFALLGLWLVIIAINAAAWLSPKHQRHAYAVALCFAAPGAMSLLALVFEGSTVAWRVIFIITAASGAIGLALFGPLQHHRRHGVIDVLDHATQWVVVALYAAIAVLALVPAHTLYTEGVLLTVLVLAGVHIAFRMMFAVGAPRDAPADKASGHPDDPASAASA